MVQSNILTGEMRERVIATEFEPATFEVEKSHITAFARAIGDDNPLWNDEVAARRSRYGGLIAPPTFTPANCQFAEAARDNTVPAPRYGAA